VPKTLTLKTPPLTEEMVLETLNDFTEAWNQGNIDGACAVYAHDATFIGKSGYVRGKDKIIERYREAYPDQASMGVLTLELLEYRPSVRTLGGASMATAVLRFKVQNQDGSETSGLALETYQLWCGRLVIVQDATVVDEKPFDQAFDPEVLATNLDASAVFLEKCADNENINWRRPVIMREYTVMQVLHQGAAFIRKFVK
jgi:ketosteroid isomerase-like protein